MKKTILLCLLVSFGICQAAVLKNDPNFKSNTRNWLTQSYWSGKLERENGMLKLIPALKGGKSWVKLLGINGQMDYFPGQIFRITLEAEGEGDFTFGLIFYGYKTSEITYLPGKTVKLTPGMKIYTADIELKKMPGRLYCYMNLEGTKPAWVKSYKLESVVRNNAKITAASGHQIVPVSAKAMPVVYQSNRKNAPVSFVQKADKVFYQNGQTDNSGKVCFQPQQLPEGEYALTALTNGAFATVYADVMNDAGYKAADSLAKKVKLQKKVHVLFIGDSLSDFYRGRNYIDKLSFWLNKYNPGKFTFRNAGVGGDLLPRVVQRLKGMKGSNKAYRQNMYDNLFSEKYDIIFVFLGQNDTYVTSKGNLDNPRTAANQQKPLMNELLAILRKNSQAEIVLISPSPSNEQLFLDRVKKNKGRDTGVFGSSKHVNRFDSVNRQICKEQKLDYVDILNPMRAMKDRKALYVEDGVHLSCKGAHVITQELLRWFSKQK